MLREAQRVAEPLLTTHDTTHQQAARHIGSSPRRLPRAALCRAVLCCAVLCVSATQHVHLQQVGLTLNASQPETVDNRLMDRDFLVNITLLCEQLRPLHVPITC